MNESALLSLGILLAAAVHVATPASANLLVNPGFETGDFSGWTVGGNSIQFGVARDKTPIPKVSTDFAPAFQNVRSGIFAGNALVKDVHDPAELITLTQVITVAPNQDIDVGFWLGNDSKNTFGIGLDNSHTNIFIDDVGVLRVGSQNIPAGSGPGDFVEFHRVFNTGDRTSVTVTFEINGSGSERAGASFDDFFFTPVPEPALVVIVTIGLVAATVFKRCAIHFSPSPLVGAGRG